MERSVCTEKMELKKLVSKLTGVRILGGSGSHKRTSRTARTSVFWKKRMIWSLPEIWDGTLILGSQFLEFSFLLRKFVFKETQFSRGLIRGMLDYSLCHSNVEALFEGDLSCLLQCLNPHSPGRTFSLRGGRCLEKEDCLWLAVPWPLGFGFQHSQGDHF